MRNVYLLILLISSQLFADIPVAGKVSGKSEEMRNNQYIIYKNSCDKVFDAFGEQIKDSANHGNNNVLVKYWRGETYDKGYFSPAISGVTSLICGSCPSEVIAEQLNKKGFKGNINQDDKLFQFDIYW